MQSKNFELRKVKIICATALLCKKKNKCILCQGHLLQNMTPNAQWAIRAAVAAFKQNINVREFFYPTTTKGLSTKK
jgi:hypothetical protein